jgi:[ribosomal protein S5]-alanine N-acetyltransferase
LSVATAPVLVGIRVTLRPPRTEDAHERAALGVIPEFVRLVGGEPVEAGPLSFEQAVAQVEQLQSRDVGWSIEFDRRFIGTAFLHSLDRHNHRARFAIGIQDAALWGLGIGEEATRLVLRHAFGEMALHRVDLRVLDDNARAIRCYEKCGFQVEGREREGALIAGEWRTDLIMSILESEWRASRH